MSPLWPQNCHQKLELANLQIRGLGPLVEKVAGHSTYIEGSLPVLSALRHLCWQLAHEYVNNT